MTRPPAETIQALGASLAYQQRRADLAVEALDRIAGTQAENYGDRERWSAYETTRDALARLADHERAYGARLASGQTEGDRLAVARAALERAQHVLNDLGRTPHHDARFEAGCHVSEARAAIDGEGET